MKLTQYEGNNVKKSRLTMPVHQIKSHICY